MRKDGKVTYLHGDHLGSASLATDASGARVSAMRYTPFGETRVGDAPTDRRFTGQRQEAGIGLYDYGARFYSASLGRFISSDTIIPDLKEPQDFNRYTYVENNPLKYLDPTGHEGEGGDGGLAPNTLPDPVKQLQLERMENMRFMLQLIRTNHWDEFFEFVAFMNSIHPGSVGVFKWSGYLPQPGDVGHAVVGVADGIFIGTAGYDSEYGVYLSSAAELYEEHYDWIQQLTIYEVQGLSEQQRLRAATFALEEYGAGYSYAGVVAGNREGGNDKKWYCSELAVAALEQGDVTFYVYDTFIFRRELSSPTLPTMISTYTTIVGSNTRYVVPFWETNGLVCTWPRHQQ